MADKFVVVGGVASAGHATYGPYLASVLALDADAGAWSMLPDLPVPLQGMACAASPGASLPLSENPNPNAPKDTYDYSCH
jgi:hypothetical protein